MGAVRCLDDPVDHHAVEDEGLQRNGFDELLGLDDAFDRDEPLLGGQAVQVVEVGVDAGVGGVAVRIADVQMHQGRIEIQRRHRDQRLGLARLAGVRRGDGLQLAFPEVDDGRAQAGADRQERQSRGGRLEAALDHALVHLPRDDLPVRAGLGEPRVVERGRVEGDEPVVRLLHLPGRAQQAQVRAPVGHDRQVRQIRAQDRADERHRLAPRPPAADADRHAAAQLADHVVERHPLVTHGVSCLLVSGWRAVCRWRRTRPGARPRRPRG